MASGITAGELGSLLDEYSTPLSLYASNWTQSGEDCVQEAFVELAAQLPCPANPVAWLFKVVRNRAINSSRSNQRRKTRELAAAKPDLEQTTNPSLRLQANEEQARLRDTLNQLENRDREIVVLRIWSDLGWKEIAELTGTSTSTAHRHYESALLKIKKLMAQVKQGSQNV